MKSVNPYKTYSSSYSETKITTNLDLENKIENVEYILNDVKTKMTEMKINSEMEHVSQIARNESMEDSIIYLKAKLSHIESILSKKTYFDKINLFVQNLFEKEPYRSAIFNAFISFFVVRIFG